MEKKKDNQVFSQKTFLSPFLTHAEKTRGIHIPWLRPTQKLRDSHHHTRLEENARVSSNEAPCRGKLPVNSFVS